MTLQEGSSDNLAKTRPLFYRTGKTFTTLPVLEKADTHTGAAPVMGWAEAMPSSPRRKRENANAVLLENIKKRVCGETVGCV